MNRVFVPHQLKTITVDTEKKIFRINGEDFGRDCTGFTISCDGPGRFDIRLEMNCTVRFVHYENSKVVSDRQGIPHSGEWVDNLQKSGNQVNDSFDDSCER